MGGYNPEEFGAGLGLDETPTGSVGADAPIEVEAEKVSEVPKAKDTIDAEYEVLPDSNELAVRAEADKKESLVKAEKILDEAQGGVDEELGNDGWSGTQEAPKEEPAAQAQEKEAPKKGGWTDELTDDITQGFIAGGFVGGAKGEGRGEGSKEVNERAQAFKDNLDETLEAYDDGRMSGKDFVAELNRSLEDVPAKMPEAERQKLAGIQNSIMKEALSRRIEENKGKEGIDAPMSALASLLSRRGYMGEVERMMAERKAAQAEAAAKKETPEEKGKAA